MFSVVAAFVLPRPRRYAETARIVRRMYGMKTIGHPSDSVRLVRITRPLAAGTASFGGWGPRVPGL